MHHIYLIRHGECLDNRNGLIPQDESPLSPLGLEDAKRIAEFFIISGTVVDRIYSGGSERAKSTAILVARILDKEQEVAVDRQFDERRFEEETHQEFFLRVQQALSKLEDSLDATTLIFTHAGFIKTSIAFIQSGSEQLYEKFIELDSAIAIRSGGIIHLSYDSNWEIDPELASRAYLPR